MQPYQLTSAASVLRVADQAIIPPDPANADWQVYLTWLSVPNTPDPAPPASSASAAASTLAAKLSAGIALTSTGTPALNGTYALDPTSTTQIYQIGLFASQFATFPSGATTQPYPDAAGTQHTFTVPQFVAFLRAVAPLVSALQTQAGVMASGGTPAWPSQSAVIA